jgi:hypothetical protein
MRPCNRDYRSLQSAAPLANSGRSRCQTANTSESLVDGAKLRFTMRARNLKTRDSSKHACIFVRAHMRARVCFSFFGASQRARLPSARTKRAHVLRWCAQSVRTSRRDPLRVEVPIAREPACDAHAPSFAKRLWCDTRLSCAKTHDRRFGSLTFGVDAGHCGPSCLFGGGVGPPPVSPIYSDGFRIAASYVIDNPIQRA